MALPHDPLWPRAGSWPAPVAGSHADVALLGVPTHATSLSPTRADTTPDAVRAALQRYSLETRLAIVDAGDIPDPDADEQAAIALVRGIDAGLVIALGGDNAATVPVALGRAARLGPALIGCGRRLDGRNACDFHFFLLRRVYR